MAITREQLQEFIAFCKTKPANEPYNFSDPHHCALSQFAKDAHHSELYGLPFEGEAIEGGFEDALNPRADHPDKDRTFGALARRLETVVL